ncbi:hypothetical protein JCM10449v2_004270 [Rhodotorula kratochvilovae]
MTPRRRQKCWRKLNSRRQAALAVRLTTVNPDVCLKEIAEGTKRIKLGDAAYKQWGIEINPQPMEVMACELAQPRLLLVHPKNGCWNGHKVTLYNPVVIERWYWYALRTRSSSLASMD